MNLALATAEEWANGVQPAPDLGTMRNRIRDYAQTSSRSSSGTSSNAGFAVAATVSALSRAIHGDISSAPHSPLPVENAVSAAAEALMYSREAFRSNAHVASHLADTADADGEADRVAADFFDSAVRSDYGILSTTSSDSVDATESGPCGPLWRNPPPKKYLEFKTEIPVSRVSEPSQGDKPLVLLLGNVDREGILSAISQSGRWYKRKVLDSSSSNWQQIINIFTESKVSAALLLLSPRTYKIIVDDDYASQREILFQQLANVPHVVFIHDDLFNGTRDCELSEEYTYPVDEQRQNVNSLLFNHSINIITYQKNSEVTLLATKFLNDCETGLMLRLYVPNNQLWAKQTDRLLELFRDYLTRVADIDVRLDETRTKAGVIYELHGDPTGSVELSNEFTNFSDFMKLCTSDPSRAEAILRDKHINQEKITEILTRYAKEVRRLQVDMKQDREQKVLRIRHRLEAELVDEMPTNVELAMIETLIEQTIPSNVGAFSPLQFNLNSTFGAARNLTLNVNPQFVNTVHGIVAQEISGDFDLNDHDQELLKLFAQYGAQRQGELVSALRELKDESAPKPGKLTAKQKIGRFLGAIASKATDIGVNVLKAYIQKQVVGP